MSQFIQFLEQYQTWIFVFAALVPALVFIAYLLITITRAKPTAKIITITEPIRVVGISTMTDKENFMQDDAVLWRKFKEIIRNSTEITNKKEEHSFISILQSADENGKFEYLIGCIVHEFGQIPEGAKIFEVPAETYAAFHIKPAKNRKKWAALRVRMEKFIHEKWLPSSGYLLNTNSSIQEIEFHKKSSSKDTQVMIFYVPIKQKGTI